MIKIINPSSFEFDQPVAQLVDLHRSTVDRDQLIKRAAADSLFHCEIAPEKGHSLIHLIAMGATDSYGSNRNGDAFYKHAQKLDLVDPNWKEITVANGDKHVKSAETFADHTETGLIDRYKTFEKFANVHRNHANKVHKGDKIWGSVKAAAYNEPMDRVELLISVPNDDWAEDLEKMANGQDIPFSMACLTDPSFPVLTESGYKPISMITVGERVFTHHGRWKKVTEVMRRKYTGTVTKLYIEGFPLPLEVTVDHPMFVQLSPAKADALVHYGVTLEENKAHGVQWVHSGHLVKSDCLMYMAPDSFDNYHPIDSIWDAMMLGAIIGGEPVAPSTLDNYKQLLGKSGHDIYLGLFNSDPEIRLSFLAAYLDSGNGAYLGDTIIFADEDLWIAMGIRDLLASMGIPSRIDIITVATEEEGKTEAILYQVEFESSYAGDLRVFSHMLKADQIHHDFHNREKHPEFSTDIYHPRSITKTETREVVDIDVYNLEVEDDHSYLVGGFVSHNCKVASDQCSVCGHKAKTREEYCDHLAHGLTDMLKSGHVISAVNDYPTFFDISRVRRNADRIAWSLMKAAGQTSDAFAVDEDEQRQLLQYPGIDVLMASQPDNVSNKMRILQKLSAIEKRFPADVRLHSLSKGVGTPTTNTQLDNLAGKHNKVASLNRALADKLICLPLDKFASLILGKSDKLAGIVKAARAGLPLLFSHSMSRLDGIAANPTYDPATSYDMGFNKLAEDLSDSMSLDPGLMRYRIITRVIQNDAPVQIDVSTRHDSAYNKEAEALLDQYASYQLSLAAHVRQSKPELFDHMLEALVAQNTV